MATEVNINAFHKDELINITLLARQPGGVGVLPDAGTADVVMTLSDTEAGAPLLEFSRASGHVSVVDVDTAEYLIALTPTDLASIVEARSYFHNIWTGPSSGRLLQAKGSFRLLRSNAPAA